PRIGMNCSVTSWFFFKKGVRRLRRLWGYPPKSAEHLPAGGAPFASLPKRIFSPTPYEFGFFVGLHCLRKSTGGWNHLGGGTSVASWRNCTANGNARPCLGRDETRCCGPFGWPECCSSRIRPPARFRKLRRRWRARTGDTRPEIVMARRDE